MPSVPKITVVVPCFNAERYVAASLDSILSQEWPNLEVIVVDDGSSDQSAQIVSSRFPNVRLLRQRNQGPAAARNKGISAASGDLIAFQDADDLWLPGKLKAQAHLLHENPSTRMVYSAWLEWESDDLVPSNEYLTCLSKLEPMPAEPSGWIYSQLLLDSYVCTITVLAQRSLFAEIGGFDESLSAGEDYDLWLRASRVTPIRKLGQVHALYRKHTSSSITKTAPATNFQALVISRALRAWGYVSPDGATVRPSEVNEALGRSWRDFSSAHARAGNWKLARQGAGSAIRFAPRHIAGWKLFLKALLHVDRMSARR